MMLRMPPCVALRMPEIVDEPSTAKDVEVAPASVVAPAVREPKVAPPVALN